MFGENRVPLNSRSVAHIKFFLFVFDRNPLHLKSQTK